MGSCWRPGPARPVWTHTAALMHGAQLQLGTVPCRGENKGSTVDCAATQPALVHSVTAKCQSQREPLLSPGCSVGCLYWTATAKVRSRCAICAKARCTTSCSRLQHQQPSQGGHDTQPSCNPCRVFRKGTTWHRWGATAPGMSPPPCRFWEGALATSSMTRDL